MSLSITAPQLAKFIFDYFGSSEFTIDEISKAWNKCSYQKYYTARWSFYVDRKTIKDALNYLGVTSRHISQKSKTIELFKIKQ